MQPVAAADLSCTPSREKRIIRATHTILRFAIQEIFKNMRWHGLRSDSIKSFALHIYSIGVAARQNAFLI